MFQAEGPARARALKLPWWSSASQCRDTRFDPSSGKKIPHAAVKSSSAAAEIWHATKKDPTPHAATETQCSHINRE